MQIVSLMVIDQVSDPEVFCEWLNDTVPVNQSETFVLMEFFLYPVKLYVNLIFSSDKMFILKVNLNLALTGDSEISENEFSGVDVFLIVLLCVTLNPVTVSAVIISVFH